jgi:APA family basic amino acid/polyamine antiporter
MTHAALKRTLGLFPVTNIVIANMIGAGIFTTSGLLMQDLHDPVVMLILWLVGGVVALCGALSYAELGAAMPEAGGEYFFLSRMYHPMLGFLSGWVSLIAGFSAPIAVSAIGCSEYVFRALPQISSALPGPEPLSTLWAKRLISLAVIAVFTIIHTRGIEFGARIQNGLTLLKVLLIGSLIVAGFAVGHGEWSHLALADGFSFSTINWQTIGLCLMWIMFAYSGWNAATYIGSEIRDPMRNLPRSLLAGTAIVTAIYVLLNLFIVYAVEPQGMEGVISIAGLAVGRAFGGALEYVVSLLIAFALFSSLSAYIILGPRVYYAMAMDRVFFTGLSAVGTASRAPFRAIILQGAIASFLVLTGSFDQILTYMGFSLGIFPLLAVASLFRLRKAGQSVLHMPGYPLVPLIYVGAGTMMLILSYLERPMESSLAICTVLAGIPVFLWFRRKKADYRQSGRPSDV